MVLWRAAIAIDVRTYVYSFVDVIVRAVIVVFVPVAGSGFPFIPYMYRKLIVARHCQPGVFMNLYFTL